MGAGESLIIGVLGLLLLAGVGFAILTLAREGSGAWRRLLARLEVRRWRAGKIVMIWLTGGLIGFVWFWIVVILYAPEGELGITAALLLGAWLAEVLALWALT